MWFMYSIWRYAGGIIFDILATISLKLIKSYKFIVTRISFQALNQDLFHFLYNKIHIERYGKFGESLKI